MDQLPKMMRRVSLLFGQSPTGSSGRSSSSRELPLIEHKKLAETRGDLMLLRDQVEEVVRALRKLNGATKGVFEAVASCASDAALAPGASEADNAHCSSATQICEAGRAGMESGESEMVPLFAKLADMGVKPLAALCDRVIPAFAPRMAKYKALVSKVESCEHALEQLQRSDRGRPASDAEVASYESERKDAAGACKGMEEQLMDDLVRIMSNRGRLATSSMVGLSACTESCLGVTTASLQGAMSHIDDAAAETIRDAALRGPLAALEELDVGADKSFRGWPVRRASFLRQMIELGAASPLASPVKGSGGGGSGRRSSPAPVAVVAGGGSSSPAPVAAAAVEEYDADAGTADDLASVSENKGKKKTLLHKAKSKIRRTSQLVLSKIGQVPKVRDDAFAGLVHTHRAAEKRLKQLGNVLKAYADATEEWVLVTEQFAMSMQQYVTPRPDETSKDTGCAELLPVATRLVQQVAAIQTARGYVTRYFIDSILQPLHHLCYQIIPSIKSEVADRHKYQTDVTVFARMAKKKGGSDEVQRRLKESRTLFTEVDSFLKKRFKDIHRRQCEVLAHTAERFATCATLIASHAGAEMMQGHPLVGGDGHEGGGGGSGDVNDSLMQARRVSELGLASTIQAAFAVEEFSGMDVIADDGNTSTPPASDGEEAIEVEEGLNDAVFGGYEATDSNFEQLLIRMVARGQPHGGDGDGDGGEEPDSTEDEEEPTTAVFDFSPLLHESTTAALRADMGNVPPPAGLGKRRKKVQGGGSEEEEEEEEEGSAFLSSCSESSSEYSDAADDSDWHKNGAASPRSSVMPPRTGKR